MGSGVRHGQGMPQRGGDEDAVVAVLPKPDDGNLDGGPGEFDVMPDYENSGDEGGVQGYSKGMRVRHPTFGVGNIFQVEGDGEMQKVSVVFHDQTFKKFVVKYARLEIL